MRITSPAPWKNVRCSCGTGLEIELSDIEVKQEHDSDGDDYLASYVTCPVCHHKVGVSNVPHHIKDARYKSQERSDYDV